MLGAFGRMATSRCLKQAAEYYKSSSYMLIRKHVDYYISVCSNHVTI